MPIAQIRYWLARRICRRYSRGYLTVVDRMGLEWALDLIDEDVELYGLPFNHALARVGVIDYAERLDDLVASGPGKRRFSPDPPGVRPHGAWYGPDGFVSTSRIV